MSWKFDDSDPARAGHVCRILCTGFDIHCAPAATAISGDAVEGGARISLSVYTTQSMLSTAYSYWTNPMYKSSGVRPFGSRFHFA